MEHIKMELIEHAAEQLASLLKEKGYSYFNFMYGKSGTDFRTGLLSCIPDDAPEGFTVSAGTAIRATSTDAPYAVANFSITGDPDGAVRVTSVRLFLYETFDGGLRVSVPITVSSPPDIPSVNDANKLLEDAWLQRCRKNTAQWKKPAPQRKGSKKGI